ncbi:nucleotide-diphospho-sugar transferase [Nibricoccus aquaticus]|uniref:Nucleotide-diphospho-sugar transferase n=1 Tax=Nibricoccus aquaticus TaxID=2576891 RepID=A0A290Q6T6_9BACT|nr:nucleotide-diphospho-sugar transferase [Nibricoccus aquaticus]ATC62890.1 nucleotide-diphospho-sugar transferase [Nibricoccus aquaticus]
MKSPLLFLIFNRPDTTATVFSRIREARPTRLYIAADGPRATRPDEARHCADTRAIATAIDWPCQVTTLFRDKNLGCKEAVSSAIDWFFSHEEEGIILEDDCVPAPDFFPFCDTLLAHHRHDHRIRHIAGCNFQQGTTRGDGSYYFSNLTHVWGWASWRRAWHDYDKDLARYTEDEIFEQLETRFHDPLLAAAWLEMAVSIKKKTVDTWDIQLAVTNLMHGGLSIIPNVNLISNIGFDSRATHTLSATDPKNAQPIGALGEIRHPSTPVADLAADLHTLHTEIKLTEARRQKYARPKYRLKRFIATLGGPRRWKRAGT